MPNRSKILRAARSSTPAIVENSDHLSSYEILDRVVRFIESDKVVLTAGEQPESCVERKVENFRKLPGNRFAYTLASIWFPLLNTDGGNTIFSGKGGICTGDDFRFYRCFWEIDRNPKGKAVWRWLAKGGEYSRYRTNTHLVVDWRNEQFLLRTKNSERYGEPGATYTYRTTSNLSARVLNEGVCFSQGGPGIVAADRAAAAFVLAYMNSFVATYCLEGMVGGGDFSVRSLLRDLEPGYCEHLPEVTLSGNDKAWFSERICGLLAILNAFDDDEAHPHFCHHRLVSKNSLRESSATQNRELFASLARAYEIVAELEGRITDLLEVTQEGVKAAYSDSGWPFPTENTLAVVSVEVLRQVEAIPRDEPSLTFSNEEVKYRFQNKLSHYLHADIEHLSHRFGVSPQLLCAGASDLAAVTPRGTQRLTSGLLTIH